ncbi:MAG: chaperone modulator CbpM [Wenzhouxiangella sp.]|jgi:chaperone modulatory protein CbpM|nr:chaperone modulator CbpM [Wenzhouxiangella sp.]
MTPSNHLPVAELIAQDLDADLEEICRICGLDVEELRQWILEGVAEPRSGSACDWQFSARQLRRVSVARRLRRDLELDARALPVVLDLIEEVETLRRRVRLLERVIED